MKNLPSRQTLAWLSPRSLVDVIGGSWWQPLCLVLCTEPSRAWISDLLSNRYWFLLFGINFWNSSWNYNKFPEYMKSQEASKRSVVRLTTSSLRRNASIDARKMSKICVPFSLPSGRFDYPAKPSTVRLPGPLKVAPVPHPQEDSVPSRFHDLSKVLAFRHASVEPQFFLFAVSTGG